MPSQDVKQNTHRWWGTLTIDENTIVKGGSLDPGVTCIFVKTSRDTHFIAQGTFLKEVKVLSSSGDVNAAMANIVDVSSPILIKLKNDMVGYPAGLPIVEILEIDSINTSPLTKELNALTESLFRDDNWLGEHGSEVGKADIELGRELPGLPKK